MLVAYPVGESLKTRRRRASASRGSTRPNVG